MRELTLDSLINFTEKYWPALLITGLALFFLIVDIFIKPLSTVSLALILLAVAPWIFEYIKSFELPGGFKFELREKLKEVEDRAEDAGLLNNFANTEKRRSYEELSAEDPILSLAALRIDIEKRLNRLFKLNEHMVERRPRNLRETVHLLSIMDILSKEEYSVINDLIPLLNAAIHAIDFNLSTAAWAVRVGPQLIESFDGKIKKYEILQPK